MRLLPYDLVIIIILNFFIPAGSCHTCVCVLWQFAKTNVSWAKFYIFYIGELLDNPVENLHDIKLSHPCNKNWNETFHIFSWYHTLTIPSENSVLNESKQESMFISICFVWYLIWHIDIWGTTGTGLCIFLICDI